MLGVEAETSSYTARTHQSQGATSYCKNATLKGSSFNHNQAMINALMCILALFYSEASCNEGILPRSAAAET